MESLSALKRAEHLEKLGSTRYDVLVVGGGITGAGIALDAASRGLKTALVEKKDFAWGTSSRSTKLIHGGLRYLKQMEIGLVREVGLERAIVHRNARHLVVPERMLLPIVQGGSLGKTLSSIGLWVYDYLAGVEKGERRRMLDKAATLAAEPLLRPDGLKGGGLYYEYRSDDARLSIENIKTAFSYGANCLNYCELVELLYDAQGKVAGARVLDVLKNDVYNVYARCVINAAGPWVDALRQKDPEGVQGKRLKLSKGVHLVVPRQRLPLRQSAYFDVLADGRMVFAIPRGQMTYIGTTDTFFEGRADAPQTTPEDARYVLDAVNAMFPDARLQMSDIVSSWAGLRPLIYEEGKNASELSRKDEIFVSRTGLISIAGGKLTGYRKMAERAVDTAVKHLREADASAYAHIAPCQTKDIKLCGGRFNSQADLEKYIARSIGEVAQIQLGAADVLPLVQKYGTETDVIIEKAFALYPIIPDAQQRLAVAELWYAVHYEMVHTLSDYLVRRTGRLYFERPSLPDLYPLLAEQLAQYFKWTPREKQQDIDAFLAEYEAVLAFVPKGSVGERQHPAR